ncbi:MAG: bifunctional adenosylcobinamide kinase/adenosylcobinamide-phosphate guanylyltransferase [Candidatus Limivivens sp.]|nr:bifunctional adenosylcobinamide kinase/adenosylcobinamide-phosphate guanylyltransferase [Candidatus Limivivens sp.]
MFLVVTGGSGSGKSAFAEDQVLKLGDRRRIYIATMMCFDEESKKRVARHREMRKNKKFETLECYTGLESVSVPEGSVVLLECMSNLTANEIYAPGGAGENTVAAVLRGIRRIRSQAAHLVVVTNEIFSDGTVYDPETTGYLQKLGRINQEMVRLADQAVEVVYGIPVYLKGEEYAS